MVKVNIMVSTVKEEQCVVLNQGINEEKSRRHPRWTRQETLTLIQAKDITENGPYKGRKMYSLMSSDNNTEPKWVMISEYCKQQGVGRGPAQCRKRWSNLIGDYKRVKYWEDNLKDKGESFWGMRNDLRKERKLPVSFDWEVFKVLVGREMGGVGAVSPLPLQAVAVAGVSYGGDEVEEGDEEEAADLEDENGNENENENGNGNENENENEFKNKNKNENENEKTVNDGKCLGVENVIMLGDQKEEILEFGLKSRDQMSEKNFASPDKPNSDGFRESWPGISYWESEEKAKRRRLSTDDPKVNNIEAEMMRVLEENNRMVNAQLDIHNKNVQLDREQRKETTDVLVAALGKLTNVLVKIAEKL